MDGPDLRLAPNGLPVTSDDAEDTRSALATRLRVAAALRRTETVKPQVWGSCRRFPCRIVIESREGAIIAATQHRKSDTFWTDGSRPDNKRVGAAVVWRLGRAPLPPRQQ